MVLGPFIMNRPVKEQKDGVQQYLILNVDELFVDFIRRRKLLCGSKFL